MSLLASIDDELRLSLPQYFCCNCGIAEDIRPVITPLTTARPLKLGRAVALELGLPYCKRCTKSATRERVSVVKKVLVAALLGSSLGIVAAITPLGNVLGAFAFYLIAAAVFAIVLACYALQKPRANQTSYHQPVRLVRVKREPSGRVAEVTLAFAHPRYARVFAHANAEAVSRGALEVLGG